LVRGRRAPIVGRVSMDYTTVDVGHIGGVQVGDMVTLVGRDGAEAISAEEVAEQAGTIAYEVTCHVGKRVKRVYVGGVDVELAPAPPGALPRPAAARVDELHETR
ncbi:MAG: alanine racemase, partial [Planctomycetota bacterium]